MESDHSRRSRRKSPSPAQHYRINMVRRVCPAEMEMVNLAGSLLLPPPKKLPSRAPPWKAVDIPGLATTVSGERVSKEVPTSQRRQRDFFAPRKQATPASLADEAEGKSGLSLPHHEYLPFKPDIFGRGNPDCNIHVANITEGQPTHLDQALPLPDPVVSLQRHLLPPVDTQSATGYFAYDEADLSHLISDSLRLTSLPPCCPAHNSNSRTRTSRVARFIMPRKCEASLQQVSRPPGIVLHRATSGTDGSHKWQNDGLATSGTESTTSKPCRWATCTACLALCLAAAALLSFWALHAFSDAVISSRHVKDNRVNPVTIRPEDEGARGLPRHLRPYEERPHTPDQEWSPRETLLPAYFGPVAESSALDWNVTNTVWKTQES